MDEEIFEIAKDNDLTLEEAEQLQNIVDETGLDVDDTEELRRELQIIYIYDQIHKKRQTKTSNKD